MANYWVISPYRFKESSRPGWARGLRPTHTDNESENIFEKAWNYDLKNGTIAVGWRELGNVSQLTDKDEFRQRFKEQFPQSGQIQYAVWKVYNEISKGDTIVARRGRKKRIGIGTVAGEAFYNEEKGRERVGDLTDDIYPNFIPVKWENKEEKDYDYQFFGMGALYRITDEDKIREINNNR